MNEKMLGRIAAIKAVVDPSFISLFDDLARESKSQLQQDLWAAADSKFKRGGFFVEFGAANGVSLSNTWLLEKRLDWTGILAEPDPRFHTKIRANRSCTLSTCGVSARTGEMVPFLLAQQGEFSTFLEFRDSDNHGARSRSSNTERIVVETVSLIDLLRQHGAPDIIDFLSIDTEGSEYEILRGFDFKSYNIRRVCVEHNFKPIRENILRLLEDNGFSRAHKTHSQWDDWYVRTE